MLSLPVFDGGARQAEVDRAGAGYEEDVAKYRQTVLSAFGEVEDNLATLRILGDQTHAQDEAVNASSRLKYVEEVSASDGLKFTSPAVKVGRATSYVMRNMIRVSLSNRNALKSWTVPTRLSQYAASA